MARFCSSPDTFFVEEIPAYLPCGEGEHAYVWIEKTNLTTTEAVGRLARMLRIDARDVGYAGMKDRHAITRQWLSLPAVDLEILRSISEAELRVLSASRHKNKLRVGHLRGNRFVIVLSDVSEADKQAVPAALARLASQGVPNRYGHQRFGKAGDNVETGLAILRGQRREPDGRRRKLFLSAVQSAVFNRVLDLRAPGGLLAVRSGDILEKVASGGQFLSSDREADQARVDAGEVVPTAPMPGSRTRAPEPGTEARALEDAALADLGLGPDELAQVGRSLPGARRPVVVKVTLEEPAVVEDGEHLRLHFSLPAGSYATVVLEALGVEHRPQGQRVLASPGLPVADG